MKKFSTILILAFFSLMIFSYVNPDYVSPVTKVVEEATPAVVKVEATVYSTSYIDPFIEDFFKRWFGDIPKQCQQKGTSLGSGF
ncbi:MAG TPA: serine protease, partial [Thermosipho africanus]|nr:serine protease [Thermosipho africanus]